MLLFNQRMTKSLWMVAWIGVLLLIPRVSAAGSFVSNSQAESHIVVKDSQSRSIIFRKQGTYFYGSTSPDRQIINKGQIVPRELIVKFKNHAEVFSGFKINPIYKIISKYPFRTRELDHQLGLTLVQLPTDANYFKTLHELSGNPNIEYVQPNYAVKAKFVPNDPYYAFQWGVQMVAADQAWNMVDFFQRSQVTVAVLDTGVNSNHEDLKDSIVPGWDFADNKHSTNDSLGHGTHVAGIIAGQANNGMGITGIASGCKIMPIKVLDGDGSGSDANIIEGIKYAADHGAQVINMSLGGPGESNALQEAINYAIKRGVNVVVAAGNENGTIDTPGNCKGVITVGAIDRDGKRAVYSNFGSKLDVVAPGTDILSTFIGESGVSAYTYYSGTSMATPFVSGVAALIKAVNHNFSPAAVTDILHRSSIDLGEPGFDKYYGFGLVNADKAVLLAARESTNLIAFNKNA
jgi:subtilisin family serine protease